MLHHALLQGLYGVFVPPGRGGTDRSNDRLRRETLMPPYSAPQTRRWARPARSCAGTLVRRHARAPPTAYATHRFANKQHENVKFLQLTFACYPQRILVYNATYYYVCN